MFKLLKFLLKNYVIDPTFTKVNKLFILSFDNEDDRTSFSKYYTATFEIKGSNALIGQKWFLDTPMKSKEQAYNQIIEMGKTNDYAAGNLLDYEYYSKHYKLIAIDLSKQTELVENTDLKQQINFIGRLEEENATIFFIIEKKNTEETTFVFSQNSVTDLV